ncbi:hypothetical protein Tco_1288874 [Tanacetum coccineum]
MVSIVSTELQSTLWAIGGPGCLATAAAELFPTSQLGLGVVSSSLFRGGVSALGISALRLVDGASRGIVALGASSSAGTNPRRDKKNGGSGGVHDPIAPWDQVHTLENMVPAPTTVGQPPHKDPQMEYSKIMPRSEQKYR